jgi:hypothetical protein
MEEGAGETYIGFDIDETGSSHIPQSIEDIGLKNRIGLFIYR